MTNLIEKQLTGALREVVESQGTLVTVLSVKVGFAGAGAGGDKAHLSLSAVDVTLTWDAFWVTIVTRVTPESGDKRRLRNRFYEISILEK